MAVTSTVGAVRALEERVAVLTEEISQLSEQRAALRKQIHLFESKLGYLKLKRAVLRFLFWPLLIVTLICSMVITGVLVSIYEGTDGGGAGEPWFLAFPVAVAAGLAAHAAYKNGRRTDQPVGMEQLLEQEQALLAQIAETEAKLEEVEGKKRELLLRESDRVEAELANSTGSPDHAAPAPAQMVTEKECPMCAENVKQRAKICRFCGHQFEVVP
jgi:predicted RNA-binding Zn-ribbon protein involved in translation (DUF1610 family)